jgi:hypothetical protein
MSQIFAESFWCLPGFNSSRYSIETKLCSPLLSALNDSSVLVSYIPGTRLPENNSIRTHEDKRAVL